MSIIDLETNQAVVTLSLVIKEKRKKEGIKEGEEEDRFYPNFYGINCKLTI